MPDYLHRTTKQHLRSVSVNSLPEAESNYILMPDLSAVEGQPSKYWVVTGDLITLADQSTRDAIDAALVESQKDSLSTNLDQVLKAVVLALNDGSFVPNSGYTKPQLKAIIKAKL